MRAGLVCESSNANVQPTEAIVNTNLTLPDVYHLWRTRRAGF